MKKRRNWYILLLLASVMLLGLASQLPTYVYLGKGVATFYSDTGQPTGAHWNQQQCGLPSRVDDASFGIAAPRDIPYCTKLLVCRGEVCVKVTVVDRRKRDGDYYDLWPAPARALGLIDDGVAEVEVYVLRNRRVP